MLTVWMKKIFQLLTSTLILLDLASITHTHTEREREREREREVSVVCVVHAGRRLTMGSRP